MFLIYYLKISSLICIIITHILLCLGTPPQLVNRGIFSKTCISVDMYLSFSHHQFLVYVCLTLLISLFIQLHLTEMEKL